jgi:hypothetical protein
LLNFFDPVDEVPWAGAGGQAGAPARKNEVYFGFGCRPAAVSMSLTPPRKETVMPPEPPRKPAPHATEVWADLLLQLRAARESVSAFLALPPAGAALAQAKADVRDGLALLDAFTLDAARHAPPAVLDLVRHAENGRPPARVYPG